MAHPARPGAAAMAVVGALGVHVLGMDRHARGLYRHGDRPPAVARYRRAAHARCGRLSGWRRAGREPHRIRAHVSRIAHRLLRGPHAPGRLGRRPGAGSLVERKSEGGRMNEWLPVIFMALMGAAVLAYVILDGYDLGVGMLMPAAS